ncbi:MAG: GTPase KRas precursor [Candidatus Heimdallarchaeota archaeon LC_3]|nr:MAG: GTPase KRas precursor [Candidatus Heimdallarchaeota archaeon LC_3]
MEASGEKINAGRLLVVGSQGGGKTALATKVASLGNPNMEYKEEFGGTIETEYLKASYDDGEFFSLLLPIGGQEKWSSLRSAFGSTAEGVIIIFDSTTKLFWPSSILQATRISPGVPYEDFPVSAVITKRDQNDVFQNEIKNMAKIIMVGFEKARTEGMSYHARGFKIIQRQFKAPVGPIPFSIGEQIIVNSLEEEYFEDIVPGSASQGKRKLKEFSLVNCRLFSRALASAIAGQQTTEDSEDAQMAFLSLLNDMRPTMMELDTTWDILLSKYPKAGKEPMIPENINESDIEIAIRTKLLATEDDVTILKQQLNNLSKETGWTVIDVLHGTVFQEEGLKEAYSMVRRLLDNVQWAKLSNKFRILDPLEELF